MSDRSKTIWNLIVGFFVISIVAVGIKLFPMNKKYDRIRDRSRNLKFGTDEELENVISFLEKRLEERNNYQFIILKEPMVLTNVLSLDGSGRRSRRNKSSIRVALIYQRENNFQAQIDYRGKVFGVTEGESVENFGEIVLIDKNQVIIKNENRLMSYPAPGLQDGLPKELSNFSIKGKNSVINRQAEKQPGLIQKTKNNDFVLVTKPVRNKQKLEKNDLQETVQDIKRPAQLAIKENNNIIEATQSRTVVPKKSLVENMFNVAIDKKNKQSRNNNKNLFNSLDNRVTTTTVKTVKKPAVDYGIFSLPTKVAPVDKPVAGIAKISKRANRLKQNKRNNKVSVTSDIAKKTASKGSATKEISSPIKKKKTIDYPTWKHELQALLGLPKPVVNGNPGLMSFNELKVLLHSEKNIDNSIFQQTYKDVGYDNFQKYLEENGVNIISMLRSKKNSSL